jgi:hypothetical protein
VEDLAAPAAPGPEEAPFFATEPAFGDVAAAAEPALAAPAVRDPSDAFAPSAVGDEELARPAAPAGEAAALFAAAGALAALLSDFAGADVGVEVSDLVAGGVAPCAAAPLAVSADGAADEVVACGPGAAALFPLAAAEAAGFGAGAGDVVGGSTTGVSAEAASATVSTGRTPRPTRTPHRKMTIDTTVVAMHKKTSCLPLSWISWKPSSSNSRVPLRTSVLIRCSIR